jgi:drug/metabolite transporter (DMT)-like permease
VETTETKKLFYILLFFAMAGWGMSWVNVKVVSSYINEYEMVFFRNAITTVTLFPLLLMRKESFRISFKSFLLILLASIIMVSYLKFFFLGTKFGTASLGGSLVTSLIPINTFILMALFFGRKIARKDIFALILGAIGVLTMLEFWSFDINEIFSVDNIYFLVASVLWALLTIVSSRSTNTSPLIFSFYMFLMSTIIVMVFFVDVPKINYTGFDYVFWINIFSLAVLANTFATSVYFVGVEKLGANEVSSFIFLVPFFAITFSHFFLGEKITLSVIIGTILTLSAVKILNNIKIIKKSKAKIV